LVVTNPIVSAFIVVAALAMFPRAGHAAESTPIERGSVVFQDECLQCHQIGAEPGGIQGPSLTGVVGRKMASVKGFAYSKVLMAKGQTWTKANLDVYLKDPSAFVPGSEMPVSIGDDRDRADLIAFLEATK